MAMLHLALSNGDHSATVLGTVACPVLRDERLGDVVKLATEAIEKAVREAVQEETAELHQRALAGPRACLECG